MPGTRHQQFERALIELAELRQKLSSPRSRYHQAAKVAEAVQSIFKAPGRRGLDCHGDQGADRGEVSSGPSRSPQCRDTVCEADEHSV